MMLFANNENYTKNSIIVCHQVSHKYHETLFEAERSVWAFRYRVYLLTEAGLQENLKGVDRGITARCIIYLVEHKGKFEKLEPNPFTVKRSLSSRLLKFDILKQAIIV